MSRSGAYHHGRLREALIEEAVAAARVDGPDGLGLRELARRVGVSHNAAYRHFAHRDDLVAVVAAHAMDALVESMGERLALVDDRDPVSRARRRLSAVGRSYVEFATTEPGWFRVAFTHRAGYGGVDLRDGGPYGLLSAALDDLVEVGFLAPAVRPGAEVVCWSGVHGFAVLTLDGALAHESREAQDVALESLLDSIDRSFGATAPS